MSFTTEQKEYIDNLVQTLTHDAWKRGKADEQKRILKIIEKKREKWSDKKLYVHFNPEEWEELKEKINSQQDNSDFASQKSTTNNLGKPADTLRGKIKGDVK